MERWIAVYNGFYEVSDHGQVRRRIGGKGARAGLILKLSIASTGYPVVTLCVDGKRRVTHVHALVASAFLGDRGDGLMVNHKDGDKTNNHISNLEYVTRAENMQHAARIGLLPSGDRHWQRKGARS